MPEDTPSTPSDAAIPIQGSGDAQDVRVRIMEAAGEVIAEVGFRDATIRDICARAGANVAAVNYHFRDKHGLYAEVFERARCASDAGWIHEITAAGQLPAERRLGMFIAGFVRKLLDPGRPGWHAKLISREMIEPTGALDVIVERSIRPQFVLLCGIVSEMLSVPAKSHPAYLCAASVIGQCLHYHHTREVTNRLYPGFYSEPGLIDIVAGHITAFTLHAIRGMAAEIRRGGGA
jgi:TetR/AcrR family transcriptional regulator, regulator of cefoperazone and chloramphenicol sensitivity